MGRTLYETLLLNVPIGHRTPAGVPQWRRAPSRPTWEIRDPSGLLELWTWQSRRIRLLVESTADGDRVTRIVLTAGDRMRAIPGWEPHTAWVLGKPAKTDAVPQRRPRRHVAGKATWRGPAVPWAAERAGSPPSGATSTLLTQLGELERDGLLPIGYSLRLGAYGIIYGTQAAIIEDLYHEEIPLPAAGLRGDADAYTLLERMTRQAERLAQAVDRLSGDLRRAAGLDPVPWDRAQRPGEVVVNALEPTVHRVLNGLRTVADERIIGQALLAWEETAYRETRQIGDRLFATVPENVFAGGRGATADERTCSLGAAERDFRARLASILPAATARRRAAKRANGRSGTRHRPLRGPELEVLERG
jgi:CRISPR system Cascade subunit CasA